MASFKDKNNQEWVLSISILDVKNLRENMTPPVLLTDSDGLGRIFDEPENQYEVIWFLVKKQAAERNIDEVAFAKIFTDSFEEATKAFLETLTNFFRQIGRQDLRELTLKILAASTKLRSIVEKNLLSPKFTQVLDTIVADEDKRQIAAMDDFLTKPTTTGQSGNWPASSE